MNSTSDTRSASSLLRSAIVWDNHGCMPLRADAEFLPQLERYRTAGVTVASINVGYGEMPRDSHMNLLSFMRQWIGARPQQYRLISSVQDVHRCKEEGKLGIVFDIESMYPVQDDPRFVRTFYDLGVRWMLIAYNRSNKAGGGCMDEDRGLTNIGRSIIDEMERVGMVLCLSHAGERTVAEALEYARNPPIYSHSNVLAIANHARNVPDQLLVKCASKGGVIGLSGIGPFLGARDDLVTALMRHVIHLLDLVGPDHIGFGLDYVFDPSELDAAVRAHPDQFPPGVDGGLAMIEPEALPFIADRLCDLGLKDHEIHGILGGNWLRTATQVWR